YDNRLKHWCLSLKYPNDHTVLYHRLIQQPEYSSGIEMNGPHYRHDHNVTRQFLLLQSRGCHWLDGQNNHSSFLPRLSKCPKVYTHYHSWQRCRASTFHRVRKSFSPSQSRERVHEFPSRLLP